MSFLEVPGGQQRDPRASITIQGMHILEVIFFYKEFKIS